MPGGLWRLRRAQWHADQQEVGSAVRSSVSIVKVARTVRTLSQTGRCQANSKTDSAPRGGTWLTGAELRACRPRALTRRLGAAAFGGVTYPGSPYARAWTPI